MYAQQYRQPPKDYGGTAIRPPEEKPAPPPDEPAPPPFLPARGLLHGDDLLIAAVMLAVMSGGWEKNALVIAALFFILL